MSARVRLIDVAKGMSITLVAFGHSHLVAMSPVAGALNRGIGLVRMPFFFFLSGLFFGASKPVGTLVREKSASLLKPYLATLGLVVLGRVLFDGAALANELPRVLYGVGTAIDMPWAPLWYLAHLWLVFPYARGLAAVATAARLPAWSAAGLLVVQTVVCLSYLHLFRNMPFTLPGMQIPLDGLPFSIDLLGVSSTYFLLGYALRDRVFRFRPDPVLVVVLLLVFLALNGLFHPRMDLNQRTVLRPVATTACGFVGIYLALSAAYALGRSTKLGALAAFVGFNSLFVLIFHACLDDLGRRAIAYVMSWEAGLGTAGTAFVAAVLSSAALGAFIRRTPMLAALYLPTKNVRSAPR